jgi:hypothetical protein
MYKRLILIMRDEHDRRLHRLEDAAHMLAHFHAQVRIEAAERFIHQHKDGTRSQGARQSDPLTFPAGQRMRIPFRQRQQPDEVQHLPHRLLDLLRVYCPRKPKAIFSETVRCGNNA